MAQQRQLLNAFAVVSDLAYCVSEVPVGSILFRRLSVSSAVSSTVLAALAALPAAPRGRDFRAGTLGLTFIGGRRVDVALLRLRAPAFAVLRAFAMLTS